MSAHLFDDVESLRSAFARARRTLHGSDLRAEIIVGGWFVLAATALWRFGGGPAPDPALALLYVLAIAVTSSIHFDTAVSFTVPVQVAFVPMLFAVAPTAVPALVLVGLVLGHLVQVRTGEAKLSRLFLCPGNAWFSFGPAVTLVVAGTSGADIGGLVLVVALVAQFGGDFASAVLREWLTDSLDIRTFVAAAGWIYAVDVALSCVGLLVAYATIHHPWAVGLAAPLMVLLSVFSRERRMRLEQVVELNDAYRGTALVLGDVIEADDAYTGEHTRGVVELATTVAARLGLSPHDCRIVEFGALLHDVGKVAIPKEIINKPGKLDEHEWTIIKAHTIEGQRMLDRVGGLMQEVGQVVRSSHERWDGQGYPDGLRGQAIPLEARIVSTCDAFNAMTTTRSYRKAMSYADAIAELRRHSGAQFDPRVVDALLTVTRRDTTAAVMLPEPEPVRAFGSDQPPRVITPAA